MIDPISIPNAAGQDYGAGDVRHISEGDALGVPELQRPTRNLAQRDNLLAAKVNEVIQDVNNKEQFVPLPVFRTTVSPNDQEIVLNYRIPPGFEARVLSAIVTSIPVSSSAELDIYFATGYGNSTGQSIVQTSTELTSSTQFYSGGEFIVVLTNRGGTTLEMIASVLTTMRPLTATGGILIPSAIIGQPGPPGPQGAPGIQGTVGPSGGPGSPGLTWQSTWNSASTYSSTDVVFWLGSSYKSKANSNINNQPDLSPTWWEFLAQEGSPGIVFKGVWSSLVTYAAGQAVQYLGSTYYLTAVSSLNQPPASNPAVWSLVAQGGSGFRFRGPWGNPPPDGLGAYQLNDVVNIVFSGSITQTYVAVGNPPNPVTPPPNSDWNQLFSAGEPAYSANTVNSNLYAEASYVAAASSGIFSSLAIPSYPGTTTYSLVEGISQDLASGHGLGMLRANFQARWGGDITLVLPNPANGAQLAWYGSDVVLSFHSSGTTVGTIPTLYAYGTENTQIINGVQVPGFAFIGTIPGQTTPSLSAFQTYINGANITFHMTTADFQNMTMALIGFQIF
jgi:hypothetical protein